MMEKVKVRIAVAVDSEGDWSASGWRDAFTKNPVEREAMDTALDGVLPGEARYWVTAELPIPKTTEVGGAVEND